MRFNDLELSNEDLEFLKVTVARMLKMKDLEIIENKFPREYVGQSYIKDQDIFVHIDPTKCELTVPIHNDRWHIGGDYMPINGSKFISYVVERHPLGLVNLTITYGEMIRSAQKMKIEVPKRRISKRKCFVYLEEEERYQQYNEIKPGDDPKKFTKNQLIAAKRIEEAEEIGKRFTLFIAPGYINYVKNFNFSIGVPDQENAVRLITNYLNLLKHTKVYLNVQYALGAISKNEFEFLYGKTVSLSKDVRILTESLPGFSQDEILTEFNKLSSKAQALFVARKEDIREEYAKLLEGVDKRRAEGVLYTIGGYFFDNGLLIPNTMEIIRRKSLFGDWSSNDFEEDFNNLLIRSLEQQ